MDIKIIKPESISDKEIKLLEDVLCSQRWEYHSSPVVTNEDIKHNVESGYYSGVDKALFFIYVDNQIAGVMRLFDLGDDFEDDETPLFDIRIKSEFRKKAIGEYAVRYLIKYVFENYPNKWRFEGTTRADNLAMRRLFEKCGFVKEAHYRKAWPDENGNKFDCTGYGILREDWESGTITTVNFTDKFI